MKGSDRLTSVQRRLSGRRFHYAWLIFFCCSLAQGVIQASSTTPFSLYVVPVTTELGFLRSSYTLTTSIHSVFITITSLCFGKLLKRFSIRQIALLGCVSKLLSSGLFMIASTLPVFYASAALMGISNGLFTTVTCSILINNWFAKNQGTVYGIALSFSGSGAMVLSYLTSGLILHHGWRTAATCLFLIVVCMSAIMLLLLCSRPEDLGMSAYGSAQTTARSGGTESAAEEGVLLSQALRGPFFWMACAMVFLIGVSCYPVSTTIAAHLSDIGFGQEAIGLIVSCSSFGTMICKIPLGYLSDKVGIRTLMTVLLGSCAIGAVILITTTSGVLLYIMPFLVGIGLAGTTMPLPFIARSLFGMREYSKFVSILNAMMTFGIAVGVPLLNKAYEAIGTYRGVYPLFVGFSILALLLLYFLTSPKVAARAKREDSR